VVEQHKEEIRELRLILTQDYALEKRIKEQLALIVILFAEIESLRRRVEDKEKEVEQVRRESLVPLKA
jgi:deoxyadenosine/deoxycytidine kinase